MVPTHLHTHNTGSTHLYMQPYTQASHTCKCTCAHRRHTPAYIHNIQTRFQAFTQRGSPWLPPHTPRRRYADIQAHIHIQTFMNQTPLHSRPSTGGRTHRHTDLDTHTRHTHFFMDTSLKHSPPHSIPKTHRPKCTRVCKSQHMLTHIPITQVCIP